MKNKKFEKLQTMNKKKTCASHKDIKIFAHIWPLFGDGDKEINFIKQMLWSPV